MEAYIPLDSRKRPFDEIATEERSSSPKAPQFQVSAPTLPFVKANNGGLDVEILSSAEVDETKTMVPAKTTPAPAPRAPLPPTTSPAPDAAGPRPGAAGRGAGPPPAPGAPSPLPAPSDPVTVPTPSPAPAPAPGLDFAAPKKPEGADFLDLAAAAGTAPTPDAPKAVKNDEINDGGVTDDNGSTAAAAAAAEPVAAGGDVFCLPVEGGAAPPGGVEPVNTGRTCSQCREAKVKCDKKDPCSRCLRRCVNSSLRKIKKLQN